MAGVALLSEVDHMCDGGCDSVHSNARSGTVWSKATTVATATGNVARQSADAAKGHLEVMCPLMKEKASKAAVVAGTAARHGLEAATEGLDVVKQTCPAVRERVSTAAVVAGSVARHHVDVAKDQFDTVRQSRPAMKGKATASAAGVVAKQRLVVAKGHMDAMRHSGPVVAARHGVDVAKERVDAAKVFLASVRYPGLAPGQSVSACDPVQVVDDPGRLIAMAFARHHLNGMEAEDAEAAADFLRSQRQPPTAAGSARLRVKASLKKVRSSLRSTKRRVTFLMKKVGLNKQFQKQRAAQRAAANEYSSERLLPSDLIGIQSMETEGYVAPPDVFELFSNEELVLQQALTESAESVEWGATPDGRRSTAINFFPVETASAVPVMPDVLAPEEMASPVAALPEVLATDELALTLSARSDVLAVHVAGDECVVHRAWFLQPSAGTWLLPVTHTLQDKSSALLLDDVQEESSNEALSNPAVLTSKISTPTCASLVQLRSCGGA